MAKNNPAAKRKGKGRGPEEPQGQPTADARLPSAAIPAVVALHPSGHDVHATASTLHAGTGHGGTWSETVNDADGGHVNDAWGEGPAAPAEYWGAPSSTTEQPATNDEGWGAPSGNGWGSPANVPGDWQEPGQPAAVGGWGQPPAPAGGGVGVHVQGKGRGGAHPQPPTPAVARAPEALGFTSFHPSAAAPAQMSPLQGWGSAPAAAWGDAPITSGWGQPAVPRPPQPPGPKPAWTNWAHEAKMVNIPPASVAAPYSYAVHGAVAVGGTRQVLSEQQRSQILSSLLDMPSQQTKAYSPQSPPQHRQQPAPHGGHPQAFHPSQHPAHMNPQLIAEQHSIMRSIQEQNARVDVRSHQHPARQSRGHPVQQTDSWDRWRNDGWGGDRASTIPEEDEEYEDDGWEDDEDEDDGWGHAHGNQRVRFSPNVAYAGQAPAPVNAPAPPPHGSNRGSTHVAHHYAPAPASVTSSSRNGTQRGSQVWMPLSASSRTMRMATGTLPTPHGSMKTIVFELAPPRNGLGENAFIDSYGEALRPAERALYNRDRPTKERFRWGFNPEKDQRVGSLLRWVAAMSNGLASIGLQRFLDSRERGALFANADFRVPSSAGEPAQPAFDWLSLSEIQGTLDSTLQSSVTLYDPASQVIVFVFLLSPSGNSMAVWRRKLSVPEALREEHGAEIEDIKAELKDNYPVYVDELPVQPEEATRSITKKKKVRFAFLRRLFGGKKKKAAAAAS